MGRVIWVRAGGRGPGGGVGSVWDGAHLQVAGSSQLALQHTWPAVHDASLEWQHPPAGPGGEGEGGEGGEGGVGGDGGPGLVPLRTSKLWTMSPS